MKELILKKCVKCGAVVEVLQDCTCDNCGIKCCGQEMVFCNANISDGAVEKHLPVVEKSDDEITVKVNHVMEDEHFIEWIMLSADGVEIKKHLKAGQAAEVKFPYFANSKVYSYCNKHGLWATEV